MSRRAALVCVLALVPLGLPDAAPAACTSAVAVDGHVLLQRAAPGGPLPPAGPERDALSPACNDAGQGDPDEPITVRALRGVPATIAVLWRGELYVNPGAQTVVRGHPLHASAPPTRARRGCRAAATFSGRVRYAEDGAVTLRGDGGSRRFALDERTRFANVPAALPVQEDQRLRVSGRRCTGRLVADRVAFLDPVMREGGYANPAGETGGGWVKWAVPAGVVLLGLSLALLWAVRPLMRR